MRSILLPAVALSLFTGQIANAAAGNPKSAAAVSARPNFDGVWQVHFQYSLQAGMPTVDGQPIPFLPWTKAVYDASARAEAAHEPWSPNNQRCLVAGDLRAMKGNFPWSITVTDKHVLILFEEDARVSLIPFKSAHAKAPKPSWYGDRIARWDGDTLVIDTVGYNQKTPFPVAIQHTTDLHTVQRIRLINGGAQLESRVLIDDPGAFTRPWETVVRFNRQPSTYKLRDYRCAEDNRDLPTIGLWGPD